MAAIVALAPAMPSRTATPPPHLTLNTSARGTPAAVPNKHIPVCSPGPRPAAKGLETPPASPPNSKAAVEQPTLSYPSDFHQIVHDPPVYSIDADSVARAIEADSTAVLPEPKLVFPWLHGLHPENQIQTAFFAQRKRSLRRTPKCLRGVTIVKAGGDLSCSRLKGAISPDELLAPELDNRHILNSNDEGLCSFLECDPREGFSIRNFQIQACKMAMLSDILVYSGDDCPRTEVLHVASRISRAQQDYARRQRASGYDVQPVSTFAALDSFSVFERDHPNLVAADSQGTLTGNVMDFFFSERMEMSIMSKATEISNNVFMGPTPDPVLDPTVGEGPAFDILIEASDLAHVPDTRTLRGLRKALEDPRHPQLQLEFPSSGSILPPTWSHNEVDMLMETCEWIYEIANQTAKNGDEEDDCGQREVCDSDGDCIMLSNLSKPKKVLIHCTDGYTESSLLGLAYFMYAEGLPVHEAWVRLHRDRGRNFFAYPTDVALLTSIQPRILEASPRWRGGNPITNSPREPQWLGRIDGSLPSRILPYMYLGNLGHANNPELLQELGVTRVLSIGEPLTWSREWSERWRPEDRMLINNIQDNGVDSLTEEFERCLRFIGECRRILPKRKFSLMLTFSQSKERLTARRH